MRYRCVVLPDSETEESDRCGVVNSGGISSKKVNANRGGKGKEQYRHESEDVKPAGSEMGDDRTRIGPEFVCVGRLSLTGLK